jgi:hypothetical protein
MNTKYGTTILVFVSGAMIALMLQTLYHQLHENSSAPADDIEASSPAAGDIATVDTPRSSHRPQPQSPALEQKVLTNQMSPSREQQELYDQILSELSSPSYLQDTTADEFLQKMEPLDPAQKENLIATARKMIARGELRLEYFKQPERLRHQTVAEGAPLPTREEQAHFDQLAGRLSDPAYVESLTYVKLAQEIQPLPPALKQEVADRLNRMLKNGEIDAGSFLGSQYAGKSDIELFFN